ncbi:MAG: Myb-like DNA-binding domain-containing protein [Chloroflexi bacterium]|nr:Myb-like DNA-binding domain-containing protein [Chloroflexota bacterium]
MPTGREKLSTKSVSVLELIAQGRSYKQILAILPTLTYLDIFNAAREALAAAATTGSAYDERLAEIRKTHSRAYEKWTNEEESQLIQCVQQGKSVGEIASHLQRQPSAIRSRMVKLNLLPGSAK